MQSGETFDAATLSTFIRQATAAIGNQRFVLSPEAEAILIAKLQLYLASSQSNSEGHHSSLPNS
jgi:hypothetical protein